MELLYRNSRDGLHDGSGDGRQSSISDKNEHQFRCTKESLGRRKQVSGFGRNIHLTINLFAMRSENTKP